MNIHLLSETFCFSAFFIKEPPLQTTRSSWEFIGQVEKTASFKMMILKYSPFSKLNKNIIIKLRTTFKIYLIIYAYLGAVEHFEVITFHILL